MSSLIEIAFKGNRKEFFLWEADEVPSLKAAVIVEADRGEDLGRVHATGELAARRSAGVPHGLGAEGAPPARKALRLATPEDVKRAEELAEQNESARRRAMERVKANGLVMKLTDAEWQWDRKKLTFYFTAEKRVDFRNLVRDLASMFRTRIELKQIGVRDEARRLDGIGRCGRQYCSSSWLPELRPVNLGVAKDQRLSLNPTQISGACGRLMCSLRYEHEFYVQSRKRFPKEGKILVTSLGEEKVVANDIFHDRVTLRRPDGDARVVALADLKREVAAAASAAGEGGAADAAIGQGDEDDVGTTVDDATESAATDSGPAAAGDRRHETRRGGGSGQSSAERRPRAGGATEHAGRGTGNGIGDGAASIAGAAAANGGDARAAEPPTSAASDAAGGAWLRLRSPLPQVPAPREPSLDATAAPAAPADDVTSSEAPSPSAAVPGASLPAAGAAAGGDAAASPPPPETTTGEESTEQRRTRRRRGRRGGRRGRGGNGDRSADTTNDQGAGSDTADSADDDLDAADPAANDTDAGAGDAPANPSTTDHRE